MLVFYPFDSGICERDNFFIKIFVVLSVIKSFCPEIFRGIMMITKKPRRPEKPPKSQYLYTYTILRKNRKTRALTDPFDNRFEVFFSN